MSRPLKRARTAGGARVQRPIDKELVVVAKATVATQVSTVLKTVTFPGTIVGLRWSMGAANDSGTLSTQLVWAIVVVQDGDAANALGLTDAGDFYTPEQNVLAFGSSVATGVDQTSVQIDGTTKTMRKLKQGDTLQFIALAEATNTWMIHGVIQFFFKT